MGVHTPARGTPTSSMAGLPAPSRGVRAAAMTIVAIVAAFGAIGTYLHSEVDARISAHDEVERDVHAAMVTHRELDALQAELAEIRGVLGAVRDEVRGLRTDVRGLRGRGR